jgi:tRNA U34 5-methylaminomethyl-2-thiouridine-forming methyltransferase MnmC
MRKRVVTRDGSHTIAIPEKGVLYHSIYGAIRESVHVFIEAGLKFVSRRLATPSIAVFEMGFGTGLNAFLTAIEAAASRQTITYTAVELFPLSWEEAGLLNYTESLGHASLFEQLHECAWNEEVKINDFFTLQKVQADLFHFSSSWRFDLVYYDAFAPSAQPELWTKEVFTKLVALLNENGVLVTYCAKSNVRRALIAAGFSVETIPGPPGKREMLRALKK